MSARIKAHTPHRERPTAAEVAEIRASTLTTGQLEKKYGLSRGMISRIKLGKRVRTEG